MASYFDRNSARDDNALEVICVVHWMPACFLILTAETEGSRLANPTYMQYSSREITLIGMRNQFFVKSSSLWANAVQDLQTSTEQENAKNQLGRKDRTCRRSVNCWATLQGEESLSRRSPKPASCRRRGGTGCRPADPFDNNNNN